MGLWYPAFVRRRPAFWAVIVFFFLVLPGALDAWVSLIQELRGAGDRQGLGFSVTEALSLASGPIGLLLIAYIALGVHQTRKPQPQVTPKEIKSTDHEDRSLRGHSSGTAQVSYAGERTPVLRASIGEIARLAHDGLTSHQVAVLLSTYKEKWIPVSGVVADVTTHGNGIISVSLDPDYPRQSYISCWFDPSYEPQISHLRRGDPISVIGKIGGIGRDGAAHLSECELLGADNREIRVLRSAGKDRPLGAAGGSQQAEDDGREDDEG